MTANTATPEPSGCALEPRPVCTAALCLWPHCLPTRERADIAATMRKIHEASSGPADG